MPGRKQLFKLVVILVLWMMLAVKLLHDGYLPHKPTITWGTTDTTHAMERTILSHFQQLHTYSKQDPPPVTESVIQSLDLSQDGTAGLNVDIRLRSNFTDITHDPGKSRQLLILSYQRCGSSFFGDIFGKHPDVMYMFEPLDGLYSYIYGTMEGWNVPSDITNHANGTARIPPTREIHGVTEVLDDIFNCKIDHIPTTILYNKFWSLFKKQHSSLSDFIHCYTNKSLNKVETCRKNNLRPICPDRFDVSNKTLHICRRELNLVRTRNFSRMPMFKKYVQCLDKIRFNATTCDGLLKSTCQHKQFRTVKTVRATMDSVEELIRRNPDLRIIHLFRDPRPVMISRKKFKESSYGLYSIVLSDEKVNLAKEAKLYCSTVMRDIKRRKELQEKFPDIIIEVIYDQFVLDLVNNTEKIYKFIDIPFPESLRDWLIHNSQGIELKQNATYIASRWQSVLSFKEAYDIREHCKDLFRVASNKWLH